MNRSTNWGLYAGVLLVVVGIAFFLDINGILPQQAWGQYLNFVIGIIILIFYWRTKRLSTLMVATFFVANGLLIAIDNRVDAFIYFSGVLVIPGIMFCVAYVARRKVGYLIPGALLSSWGIYTALLTGGVFQSFLMGTGMLFVFTGLAFLVIALFDPHPWSLIPAGVMGIMGLMISAFGCDPTTRYLIFNGTCIGAIVLGIVLIIKNLYLNKHNRRED